LLALALAVAAVGDLPPRVDWPRPLPITCVNNLKQVGLAFRTWAIDHDEHFPFNLSTNDGGTMELCDRRGDGLERNSAGHFRVMSNELGSPLILVCPRDGAKRAAQSFATLGPENVTYLLHSGRNATSGQPQEVLAQCPLDGNILHCDGSVTAAGGAEPERARGSMIDLLKFNARFRHRATRAVTLALLGCLLLLGGNRLRSPGPSP